MPPPVSESPGVSESPEPAPSHSSAGVEPLGHDQPEWSGAPLHTGIESPVRASPRIAELAAQRPRELEALALGVGHPRAALRLRSATTAWDALALGALWRSRRKRQLLVFDRFLTSWLGCRRPRGETSVTS